MTHGPIYSWILEGMGWKFYRIWSTDWFRNKSVEQRRLLKAATDAVNNPTKVNTEQMEEQPKETFEEIVVKGHFKFPPYLEADIYELSDQYLPKDFKGMIKAILEIEAPLSEEWLLRRIVWLFGREKVTNVVRQAYEEQMSGCKRYGIIRKNGFLYLNNGKEVQFRVAGDVIRDVRLIAPEELAAGMYEIMKQNVSVDKSGLYHALAAQCEVSRMGAGIVEAMDDAFDLLKNRIVINGNQISIK